MRVLVSANSVCPNAGSEPGVGWNICTRLARYHDITVLCAPIAHGRPNWDYRKAIEDHLAAHGPVAGLTFHFVEPPLLTRICKRETFPWRQTVFYAGYAAWQRAALREARRLHAQRPFDLVHHLNVIGYREPGYLWKLGVPFVWGPVAGASGIPWPYFGQFGWRDRVVYALRNVKNAMDMTFAARPRRAAAAASAIFAANEDARRLISDHWGFHSEILLETGAELRPEARVRDYDDSRPLRLIWSGSHIGLKCLPLLLRALAMIKDRCAVTLSVLGRGPETPRWTAMAERLGIASLITWSGSLPRERALAEMARADVLVHTSVKEGTPHVVLEALSLGLPVICHDACGMGVAVTEACGVKIPMVDQRRSRLGFAEAVRYLATDRTALGRLSRGAIARAAGLSWDLNVEAIAQTYNRTVARNIQRLEDLPPGAITSAL